MSHLVIGLISGTSLDGIDAALIEVEGRSLQLLKFETYPYPAPLGRQLLAVSAPGGGSTEEICRLNVLLGELFAQAALKLIAKAKLKPNHIQLIGSHGQTIQHLPSPVEQLGYQLRCTLQLGEAAVIAQRTGITTVADFRPADLAAGGQGAPLLPLLHYRLFQGQENLIVQNIGGISNLTYIPAQGKLKDVIAFDTGPGNMLLDGLMQYYSRGRQSYDHNGIQAAKGKLCQPLLDELLQHPYLGKAPPKTCGREEFGNPLLKQIIKQGKKYKLSAEDVLHSATAFSAQTILQAYRDFIFPRAAVKKVLVCGGGRHNLAVMFFLQGGLDIPIVPVDDYGVCGDALEAMGFALLAYETICGRSGNLPAATGAQQAVTLGKIVWGKNYSYWQQHFLTG